MAKIEDIKQEERGMSPEQQKKVDAQLKSNELREQFSQNQEFERVGGADYGRIKSLTDDEKKELKRVNNSYDSLDPYRSSGFVRGKTPLSIYDFSSWLKDIVTQERPVNKPVLSEDERRESEQSGREYLHKSIGFAKAAFNGGDQRIAVDALKSADLLKDPSIEQWLMDVVVKLATSENPKDFEKAQDLRKSALPNELVGKVRDRTKLELKRLDEVANTQFQIEAVHNEGEEQRLSKELSTAIGVVTDLRSEVQDTKLWLQMYRKEDGVVGTLWKRLTGGRTRSDVRASLKILETRYEQAQQREMEVRREIKELKGKDEEIIKRRSLLMDRYNAA